MLLIRCLGVVGVSHDPGETDLPPAQRRILAILVAAGQNGISSEAIAEELYFNTTLPEKWNGAFRKAMHRLRDAVDVVTTSGRYRIDQAGQEVDVWQLRIADQLDLDSASEDRLQRLLVGDPFPGVDLSPLLSAAVEEAASLRIELVQRMLDAARNDWSTRTLHAIRTLAARQHYRERLLAPAVQLHIDAGHRAEARQLVDIASEYLERELGVTLDPAIRSLVTSDPRDRTTASFDAPIDGRIVGMSTRTNVLGSVPRPQLIALADKGLNTGGVLLHGESGAGKTELLRSLAEHWAASGSHVLCLTGRRGASTAYGPFLAVAPSMEQDLAPLFDEADDALLRTKCWTAARRRLAVEFAGLPLTLIVDDAQWLDSHSQQLVDFLASSTTDPPIRLVIAGRNSQTNTGWKLFADELMRVGLEPVSVSEFSIDDLVELIGIHHPGSTSKQRRDFATALVDRKAALPLVAQELIQSAAPDTLALVQHHVDSERAEIWTGRVNEATRRVAAVAAVLGTRFRVADLAALGDWDIEYVGQAAGELEDAEILVMGQRPDEFSFRHVLIHGEFDAILNRGERRRLHFDAAVLASTAGAVHARAIHVVEAGALMDNNDVVEAVLASARVFHQHGSYREAVAAFTRARSISRIEISPRDLIKFAAAIASSGGDGWEIRSFAFEAAQLAGDAALSLEIALVGVQRTEDTMGDQRRIAMLEQIVPSALSEELQVAHAAALARELGLLGFHERALEVSGQAMRSAASAANRLTAWLGGWAACRSIPPAEWPALPDDRNSVTDPELMARLAQIECAQALVRGDDGVARAQHMLFHSYAVTQSDPFRQWHASLVSAMFAFVDGDWALHQILANAARDDASQHGVIASFSTRAAQLFVQRWVVGQHAELLSFLEEAPPDLQNSFLAQAARAVALSEFPDRWAAAARLIEQVAQQAAKQRSPFSHPAAGLLASAPPELLTNEIRAQLRSLLDPFDGTALVVGAGVSHAGPVSWSLANLATDREKRATLLQRASDEADRWKLKLWSVRCRVDLAAQTRDYSFLDEARLLAHGTDLVKLLPDVGGVTAAPD